MLVKSSPTIGPDLEKQVMTLLKSGSPVESPIIVKDATLVTTIPRSMSVDAGKENECGVLEVHGRLVLAAVGDIARECEAGLCRARSGGSDVVLD